MLNTFFGFTRLPFQHLTNLTAIFTTQSLSSIKDRFQDFCLTKGIALISGDSGCGKTTVIKHLVATHLNTNRFKPFYLTQYPPSAKGFLKLLISMLGYPPKFYMEDILLQFPIIIRDIISKTKLTPFFIFDEAQNLSPSILEELRLITNQNQETIPVMILVAHGAFKDKLKMSCFEPLRYRLSWVSTVDPLSKSDMGHYIGFHLNLAGVTTSLFSDEAIISIFNASKGLPRLINRICIESLYLAAQKNMNPIESSIVDSVVSEFI